MKSNIDRYMQKYSVDGFKMKSFYIGINPYNDNVIILESITRFIDGYDLKHIELSISSINERFARMEGILEERFQTKIK